MNNRVKFFGVFASTSLAALLLVGAVIGKSASPDGPYHHLAVYTEVLSRIKSEYVEEPDMKSVTLGALNGLLESIDPFASYLNADQYKEYLKKKDAYKGDVGLVLSKRAGYVAVVSAMPGSPAAQAGIAAGGFIQTNKRGGAPGRPPPLAQGTTPGGPPATAQTSVVQRPR